MPFISSKVQFHKKRRAGSTASSSRAGPVKQKLRERRGHGTVGRSMPLMSVGATTLAEVLPTDMGATTLDAVAELVAPVGACPPGKIRNPATGRCVKADGKIGRGIRGMPK